MKKAVFLALASFCGASIASGSYEGIFQQRDQAGSYLSVHIDGDSFIGTIYNIDSLNNNSISLFDGIKPRQINTWNLLSGTFDGNVAEFSGEVRLNTCEVKGEVSFSKNTASLIIKSSKATAVGQENKVDCAQKFPAGQQFIFDKVYKKDKDPSGHSGTLTAENATLTCSNEYSLKKVNISFNLISKLDIPISRIGFKVDYTNSLAPIPLIASADFYYDIVGGMAAGTTQYLSLQPNMYHDFSEKASKYCGYPGGKVIVQPIYFLDKDGKQFNL